MSYLWPFLPVYSSSRYDMTRAGCHGQIELRWQLFRLAEKFVILRFVFVLSPADKKVDLIVFSAHLTLLERTLAVDICLSVRQTHGS